MEDATDFDGWVLILIKTVTSPLGTFGSLVVVAYVIYKLVTSYVEGGRKLTKAGKAAANWTSRQISRPRNSVGISIVASILSLGTQVAWVACTYVAGNFISFPFRHIEAAHTIEDVRRALEWNTTTEIYVTICILSLMGSYIAAFKESDAALPLIGLCSIPGLFWGGIGFLGAAFLSIWTLLGLPTGLPESSDLGAFWIIVGSGVTFVGLTYLALTSPATLRTSWRQT